MTVLDRPLSTERSPADAAEQKLLRQTLAILEERRAGRSYSELARETGVSRPMLRALELNNIPPGLDTLAHLVAWDEKTFGEIVINYLKFRSRLLKTKTLRLT